MPNKIITIQLQSAEYGGDNLGDDIRIDLNVGGVNATISGQIEHGTTRTFNKPLSRFQSTNNTVRIAVSATVTEKDIIYNDVGSASGNLTADLNAAASQPIGSVKVNVPGSGGDKGDTGIFTLNFTAKLEEIYRFVPDISRGWLLVRIESTGTNESLPYTVAVSYVKTERGREYFTILEGAYRTKSASVSLNTDRTSRFLTTDPRSRGVRLRFTKSTGVLEVLGTTSRYQTITDPGDPIPNGEWDIEIPDYPHALGASYQNRAQRAKTWFHLGHSGDRYLHTGRRSAGCVTVTEVERWDELYLQIIGARKGDGVSVGVLEVR
jgi:hypothetical protein